MVAQDGIGALLRAIRERAGRTRDEQAKVIQEAQGGRWFDWENIKRWETERRLPVSDWPETIARAYGLKIADVQRAVSVSRQQRRRENEDVNRRRFFGVAAATVGATALPNGSQGPRPPARSDRARCLAGLTEHRADGATRMVMTQGKGSGRVAYCTTTESPVDDFSPEVEFP
ncbi:hypothetical protein [Streptomyces sp. NPDC060188]|uniref:hypothetical protein n=1 Tax=Streptomyces sp. NPDC060188 TaxID=3347068 RepID=UPI003659A341